MIDSSKYIQSKLSETNSTCLILTRNFIKKIPLNFKEYKANETYLANDCCTNTVLLNNCQTFNEIISRNFFRL